MIECTNECNNPWWILVRRKKLFSSGTKNKPEWYISKYNTFANIDDARLFRTGSWGSTAFKTKFCSDIKPIHPGTGTGTRTGTGTGMLSRLYNHHQHKSNIIRNKEYTNIRMNITNEGNNVWIRAWI